MLFLYALLEPGVLVVECVMPGRCVVFVDLSFGKGKEKGGKIGGRTLGET
jgi:hypothetical protein